MLGGPAVTARPSSSPVFNLPDGYSVSSPTLNIADNTWLGFTMCPADWDSSEEVNSTDISAFLTDWLHSVQEGNLTADFNSDNQVNSSDISAFLTAWLDAVTTGC